MLTVIKYSQQRQRPPNELFTEEQSYLADKLGLTGVKIKDLMNDEKLLADTTAKLSDEYEWMDAKQKAAVKVGPRLSCYY